MDDHLGVAGGVEGVTGRLELGSQLPVVVDFAVEHEPDRAIFVVDRLLPGGQVDDAQAAHAESDAGLDVNSLVVGPAVADHFTHAVHEPEFGLVAGRRKAVAEFTVSESSYSTHRLVLSPSGIQGRSATGT